MAETHTARLMTPKTTAAIRRAIETVFFLLSKVISAHILSVGYGARMRVLYQFKLLMSIALALDTLTLYVV